MIRSSSIHGSTLAFVVAGALFLGGCGDGSGGSGGSGGQGTTTTTTDTTTASGGGGAGGATATGGAGGSTEVELGDVAVTVNYAGAQTGTLSIAAVTSFPPSGPPVAYQTFPTPTFPQTGKLIGIEVDKPVYVVAVLDLGNNNPQSPGPEDLVAITMPAVDLVANGEVQVDLTLMDK
ncbi:MAG: hypothetical protein U0441_28370 [Polyangiaceae bacterium]